MYKLNKDLGSYYIRAIIQTGFGKNFHLISHRKQVPVGISVSALKRQPVNHACSRRNGGIRPHVFSDLHAASTNPGSAPGLVPGQKAPPLSALWGLCGSPSLAVRTLKASTMSQRKQQRKMQEGPIKGHSVWECMTCAVNAIERVMTACQAANEGLCTPEII